MPMKKGAKRIHRLVVLPDYQGCGIGTQFISKVAQIEQSLGFQVSLVTTTPAISNALKRHKDWILARAGRSTCGYKGTLARQQYESVKHFTNASSSNRFTYSFWHKRGLK